MIWLIILTAISYCQDVDIVAPKDTTSAWNKIFSKDGTFVVIADTCFVVDDSIHWYIDIYMSTGDPDNVLKYSREWIKSLEELGSEENKRKNPLHL